MPQDHRDVNQHFSPENTRNKLVDETHRLNLDLL